MIRKKSARGYVFVGSLALLSMMMTTGIASAAADPTPAEAELATARALFEEGLAREDAKDWEGALQRFRRVAEIRVTPQVIYNIALCLEHTGKLASADRDYVRVEKAGSEASAEASVRELARLAAVRRREIHTSIPEVTITLEAPAQNGDLFVTLDGAPLATSAMNVPFAIDPGKHELVSKRRGGVEARRPFTVAVGSRSTVTVPLPADPNASAAKKDGEDDHDVPVAAWITGGVGVAAIGVGIFSVVSRSSAIDELDAACGPNRDACPESKRGTADRVDSMTTLANVSFGVAIVATIATAAILYFVWKPSGSATSTSTSTLFTSGFRF